MNIRKHWKKVILSCAAAFWASCGDDSVPLYGAIEVHNSSSVDSSSSEPAPSFEVNSSNSIAPASSSESFPSTKEKSSSSVAPALSSDTPASSASEPASSSEEGDKIACVETTFEKKYADWSYQTHGVKCEDGEEYELESICPDYGIDSKCSDIYIGKNGKVYSEEKFKKIYKMAKADGSSSSSEEKAGIIDSNLIVSPAGVKVGDKFITDGDTCEVVSTYDNWFGGATGHIKGLSEGATEISSKIDSLTKNETISDDKRACFEDIKTTLDRIIPLYGTTPEDYPQEVKCSDGIVKETEHYKARLKEYNEGFEEGYNETIEEGNEMIDECQK